MVNLRNSSGPLKRFLDVSVCPKCRSSFHLPRIKNTLVCRENSNHQYKFNKWGFYSFSENPKPDKYHDKDYVLEYVWVAFGYKFINTSDCNIFVGIGHSEGLYRCISDLAIKSALQNRNKGQEKFFVLDLGCGVGRCAADIASNLPNSFVIGLDHSEQMIKVARDIILGEGLLALDFSKYGFGKSNISCFGLSNIFFAQADASRPPLGIPDEDPKFGFDLIVNSMLIDRIQAHSGIEECLSYSVSLLKKNGTLIFACPSNWINSETWDRYGRSRTAILKQLENFGLSVETAFDGLAYRELMDPHGMYLELPVLVAKGKKIF